MSVPTFIVGTGRCGSTMLSNMLREHPNVLSLSEFFAFVGEGGLEPRAFCPDTIDGQEFWSIVAARGPVATFHLHHRVPMPERLYPYDSPAARFSWQTGVPAILHTTLPLLTDDYDALFDMLESEVTRWPRASIAAHYQDLFGWLSRYFGKSLWIERSGGSLVNVEHFLNMYPDARLIHIARDGRDAALSMHAHMAFRVHVILASLTQHLGVNPLVSSDRTRIDCVPPELRPFLPETFNADALQAYPVPLSLCGEYWAQQIEMGENALSALPPDRLLTLRYEDILADPKRQLDIFAAFLGDNFVDEAWSMRCAATLRQPRSTWRDLPEEEARVLNEACRPGFELLREAGVLYDI